MAQVTINIATPINAGVINEKGSVLSFAEYIQHYWSAQTATVAVTTTSTTTTVNYSVLPSGMSAAALEATLITDANTYNAKTLSSIEQIVVNYTNGLYVDYKKARKALQDLVYPSFPGNWATMTEIEKKICASWFIVPESMQSEVYPLESQRIENGNIFNALSTESRAARYNAGRMFIFNRLVDYADKAEVVEDTQATCTITIGSTQYDVFNLDRKYIESGQESLALGDNVGLFDYVEYSLRNKSFATTTGTMSDLADQVLDILQNGNY